MKHYVVYVPGLADKLNYSFGQRTALALWRTGGVIPYYFVVNWRDTAEIYEQKLARLLNTIDEAKAKGYTVSLVAASAGSGLALAAFAERTHDIHHVVSICGKLSRPDTVPPALFDINPAFKASMAAYPRMERRLSLADRKKILVVRATRDSYVPASDGEVKGAYAYTIHSIGHVFSIMLALTMYSGRIVRFVKHGAPK